MARISKRTENTADAFSNPTTISVLDGIDKNLHHLFLPQIEALGMMPVQKKYGVVSYLNPDRGHGSAWMAGIGSDCLVTVLDLSVDDSVDLTSQSPGYLCLGSMSRGSLESMPVPVEMRKANDLIMYCQDAGAYPYRLKPHTPYISRSICFTPRFIKQLAVEYSTEPDIFIEKLSEVSRTLSSPQMEFMLNRLQICESDSAATGFRLTALMSEAIACLIEVSSEELVADKMHGTVAAADLVKGVNDLIRCRLAEPLTLNGIAKQMCVSRAHLASIYKKETGSGVAESLRKHRIERAKQLMAETGLTLSEISRQVGYPRQSSFTEAFKREVGCSPNKWRRDGDVSTLS